MSATNASYAAMRELGNILSKWLPTFVFTESNDSSLNPVLTISADSTPAAGEKVIVIRMAALGNSDAKDIFGNAQPDYSRHTYDICTEKNFEGTTDNVLDILGPAELLPVLGEVCKRGSFVRWYRSTAGTVPSTTQMTAANLGMEWKNLYWNRLAAV